MYRMLKPTALIVVVFLMVCCNNVAETRQLVTPEESAKMDSMASPILQLVADADTVLSEIYGKETMPNIVIDSLKEPLPAYELEGLFSTGNAKVVQYKFKSGSGNAFPAFWILKADYPDTQNRELAFEALKIDGDLAGDKSRVPGLTYTNDYVVSAGHSIYWLNTGCNTSWDNHTKTRKLLYKLFDISNPTDSIVCRCGNRCK